MQRIRKPSPGRGRVRFLTEDERPRLLHACRENSKAFLYPMVMIALSTGGRKNEIRTLRRPAVDFAQGAERPPRRRGAERFGGAGPAPPSGECLGVSSGQWA